eukprot:TRINITY_DN6815_c1_g1_i2.p1 TRINITY_DN6815_c1_g1~~TRINITY_DN6815_c1_g1_i2.p1  ORF type:complete len:302 (+),score=68.46 TRINITY_DN6815_c1_g1_i2:55-960(+)
MAASSATVPAFMQGTDMDDLEDRLFVMGVGQDVLDSWVAREAASAPSGGPASVLDSGMRRQALKYLVALSDGFEQLALSCSYNGLDEAGMKRMAATSLAVAIFYRLDDRVLLGTVAALQPNTAELEQLQQQELQRSCCAVAWLAVKTCAGNAFHNVRQEAPPGTAERELEILRALGWSVWCPSLFSWIAFFRERLLALQTTSLGEQATNDWLNVCLSMVSFIIANPGENQQLPPRRLAGGIVYLAFRQICMQQGIADSTISEVMALLVLVTGLDQDIVVDSARVASTDLMFYSITQNHAAV